MKTTFLFPKALYIALFSLFLLVSIPATAQIDFPDDVDDEAPAAPVDGLLGLGLAAGAWYGIRKVRGNKGSSD